MKCEGAPADIAEINSEFSTRFQAILRKNNDIVRACYIVYEFLRARDSELHQESVEQSGGLSKYLGERWMRLNSPFYEQIFKHLEEKF